MKEQDVIQRYMSLPKFIFLLQNGSFFMPRMSVFSDSLEGGLTAKDFVGRSNFTEKLDLILNGVFPVVDEKYNEREKRLHESRHIFNEISEKAFHTPFGIYSSDDLDFIFPKCREWIYVNCWHRSPHECLAMWKVYGVDKNSVCVFTTVNNLKNQLVMNESIDTLILEDVRYLDHASDKFNDNFLSPFLSKSLSFSFEKELRIVGYDSSLDLAKVDKNNSSGINVEIRSMSGLIDRVVVSPEADTWFLDSVQRLCDDFDLNVLVESSSLTFKRIETFFDAIAQIK